jgi:hypothetical protein
MGSHNAQNKLKMDERKLYGILIENIYYVELSQT